MNWLTTILEAFGKPFKWWVVVALYEQGIRVRLGKTVVLLGPGIHLRIPFLDRIYVQSRRVRTLSTTGQTVSTRDGHPLILAIAIHFSIEDMAVFYNTLASPETTINTRCEAAIAKYVSTHDRGDITPRSIVRAVGDELPDSWARGCGLSRLEVEICGFVFARTIRLMMNDYQHGAGLYSIEHGRDDQRDGSR